jgi:hypothetical protein
MAASSPYLNDALHLSCPCEQILLNLIDEILEDRMQADIKQEKLKKRRASRALLAEKRSKIPKTVAKNISKRKQSKAKCGSRQFEDQKTFCCQGNSTLSSSVDQRHTATRAVQGLVRNARRILDEWERSYVYRTTNSVVQHRV